ncbi:hypothetical protein DPMN_156996 [Dreissena polymorpha]|uniref:Uncharacterized protein n=1 Tax=Dreissena polymorpha TaxID=45954 RepID=A0A9D4FU67_DREPO|nr:hypothetical protein DPMN_156996 [Dreissena polymorpha]
MTQQSSGKLNNVSSQTGPRLSRLQRLLIISNNDHHHSSEFALTTDDKESKNLLKSPLIQNKDPDNNVVLDQPHLALQSSQLSMSVETHGGSKEPTQHLRLNHTLQHLNKICERYTLPTAPAASIVMKSSNSPQYSPCSQGQVQQQKPIDTNKLAYQIDSLLQLLVIHRKRSDG